MKLYAYIIAGIALTAAGAPVRMQPASSPLNDYNLSFNANETRMVFARSQADFKNAHIYVASRTATGWSEPVRIAFSDERHSDSDPWLTPDGNTLYFISDRPAAGRSEDQKDYDIWRSSRTSSGWSPPEHLGPEINSSGQELGPELHGNSLYFSSSRKGGAGGLDIYRADEDGGSFKPATSLPPPFNSADSESDFTLDRSGNKALFWRIVRGRGVIHLARRDGMKWSAPEPLPETINLGGFNFTPSFSRDGRSIRFASTVAREGQEDGMADIYEAELPD